MFKKSKRLAPFDESTLEGLRKSALADNEEAEIILDTARRIRVLLYQLFEAIALQGTEKLEQRVLTELNLAFAEALQFKVLTVVGGQL